MTHAQNPAYDAIVLLVRSLMRVLVFDDRCGEQKFTNRLQSFTNQEMTITDSQEWIYMTKAPEVYKRLAEESRFVSFPTSDGNYFATQARCISWRQKTSTSS